MNSLSFSWVDYLFRELTMNSLSFSQIHSLFHGFCIYFANKLWKYFLFCEFTMKLLYFSPIYFEFTIYFANLLLNCISFSRSHYFFRELTIFFATQLWIHSLFHKSSIFLWIYNEFTIYYSNSPWIVCFANLLWIHYQFCKFIMNSKINLANLLCK